jgi:hypothetical protein
VIEGRTVRKLVKAMKKYKFKAKIEAGKSTENGKIPANWNVSGTRGPSLFPLGLIYNESNFCV